MTGRFLLACLLLCFLSTGAYAQEAAPPADTSRSPIVADVDFVGNEQFPDELLALRVRTKPNRRFLNIPGLTTWRWVYGLGASGALGDRLSEALMASGEAPAYLDSTLLAADVERLRLFYQQEGFREAAVGARVDTLAGGRSVRVVFELEPGAPTYLRRIAYEGLGELTPEQQWRLARGSLLQTERVPREAPLQLQARGQRYSEPTLLEERRRLLTFLRNAGFAAVSRDSIRAIIVPQQPDSFDVTFRVRPGPRYRFGDVHFDVVGQEEEAALRVDTLLRVPAGAEAAGGVVTVRMQGEGGLDPDLLLRTLQFSPGDLYDQSRLLATKRRLEATGVFTFTDITPAAVDTMGAVPHLAHRIELRTRRRHQVRLETFMLQRGVSTATDGGVLGGPEDELALGAGLSYENANLLGGGETFQVRATGSIAADDLANIQPDSLSAQAEVATSLTYPYLVAPFQGLDRLLDLYDARTSFSFSLLTARREELRLIIRGRGVARARLEMQHTPTVTSFVDLFDLSLSNPDTLKGFQEVFLDRILGDTLFIEDPVQRAQIIEDYTRPQINTALRYSLRSARVNPLRRDRGYSYEASVSVGSNLLYLLDRFVFTPGAVEGSLPGLPIFSGGRTGSRLIYRQYARLTGDLRQYRPLGRTSVLAFKLLGGFVHPIGQADLVPFDRRFYSGGATSVRGWDLRRLGPGAANLALTDVDTSFSNPADVANILGGDIKLETSLELRQTLFRNILAAEWISALFIDAGNVWFGPRNPGFGRRDRDVPPGATPDGEDASEEDGRFRLGSFYREFGVGSGVGLRVAWEYLIVRLDLAYKVYDPARAEEGFFPEGFRGLLPAGPRLHFGIGHAF